MATVQVHEGQGRHMAEEHIRAEIAESGSLLEGVGGIAAVVLAIVALAGILPLYLTAIAAIALGVAFVLEGVADAARYAKLSVGSVEVSGLIRAGAGSGMSMAIITGIAGVALGILSLLNIAAMVLLPIAAIVFGVGLAVGSGARSRLGRHVIEGFQAHPFARLIAHEVMQVATLVELVVGIGAAILGILALVGHAPLILVQVALLSLGAAVVLGGLALSGKIFGVLHGG